MGTKRHTPKCDCNEYEHQVCDVCQKVKGKKLKDKRKKPKLGRAVRKVTLTVYCFAVDAKEVQDSLHGWFAQNEYPLAVCRISKDMPKTLEEYQNALGNLDW